MKVSDDNINEDLTPLIFKYKGFDLSADFLGRQDSNAVKILFLHGAGQSTKERFLPLRTLLWSHYNYSSYAFDFLGQGDTQGQMSCSSLEDRLNQAFSFCNKYLNNKTVTVLGSSMSAYTAILLSEKIKVDNLILMVPAVYTKDAFNISFGKEFSNIIRQHKSWLDTDAFDILSNFNGNLLILSAENDEVIPSQIPELLIQSANKANYRKHVILEHCPHHILECINTNDDKMNRILQFLYNLIYYNNKNNT